MSLTALSPLDGRYHAQVRALSDYFSEFALHRYRLLVEVEYLIAQIGVLGQAHGLDPLAFERLRSLVATFGPEDAANVRERERRTNHDVKALEYHLKARLRELGGFEDFIERVHFGITSEDVNNLAYSLMLRDAWRDVLMPALADLVESLTGLAERTAELPMLALTHGQPASPTTLGKELGVFLTRLDGELADLINFRFSGKFSGATGTYGALGAAHPEIDWVAFAGRFVTDLGLVPALITTQIEPHDGVAAFLDGLRRIDHILLDLSQDVWRYVSDGVFRSRVVPGEIGSSTMPHKVNPIDFENAEGNLGLATALMTFMGEKLTRSRLQRDLSDSTVLRNLGVALGHVLLAYRSIRKGLEKLEVDRDVLARDLADHPEILAEPYQTILRAAGYPEPYERLKEATRGGKVTLDDLHALVDRLDISRELAARLKGLTPEGYVGVAPRLAAMAVDVARKLVARMRA
ncbi:MAG: adenylosuccinate lyase [bacterium]|nr:adenylosuccinate lyase [bacterium]